MHPWIWLNEPQHASALQSVLAMITTCGSVAAIFFAWRAFRTASEQLEGSVMPFLGLAQETIDGGKFWVLKNSGAGVALNIQAQWLDTIANTPVLAQPSTRDSSPTLLLLDPIPVGERHVLCPAGTEADTVRLLLDTGTFYIQYQSLQGREYRTVVYFDGQRFDRYPGRLTGPREESQLDRSL